MAIDYRKTAGELVRELGGNENIINVTQRTIPGPIPAMNSLPIVRPDSGSY